LSNLKEHDKRAMLETLQNYIDRQFPPSSIQAAWSKAKAILESDTVEVFVKSRPLTRSDVDYDWRTSSPITCAGPCGKEFKEGDYTNWLIANIPVHMSSRMFCDSCANQLGFPKQKERVSQ
jgi:hypothetical protein